MKGLICYLAHLKVGKIVLWCYLIWYIVTVYFHFDPAPMIWLNSIGISGVIGTALVLSVATSDTKIKSWQTVRLYLMPFCVSSFAALIKGKDFFVVISPDWQETGIAIASCVVFVAIVLSAKLIKS
ncbi:MAG: hypothetical protein MUC48_25080 [Leptolyngbya sp. Prado105]|jgi:hypothetical protein|nr:hypothetical protein [Leptolyngbya sp. Prado105]